MLIFSHHEITGLVAAYGYGTVMGLNTLESMGVPVPGETALIVAAAYAGTSHELNIWVLVAATAAAAIVGDVISYLMGRWLGFWLLHRHGRWLGLSPARTKLGQYLFLRYGTRVVFFGRFLSILRGPIAFLSGANQMSFSRFFLAAGSGSTVWAILFGFGPYLLGKGASHLAKPAGITLTVLAILLLITAVVFLHRNEARLVAEAERALPGPLGPLPLS
ncbi:MAG: DedA family protein [Alphaproteobacteria bacterium]|nr:DedA family protein [Alphaproteobacteria bacterium]